MICPYSKEVNVKCKDQDGYFYKKPVFLPCGKCYVCRQNLVNSWIPRFIAECKTSDFQLFVTLTYSDEKLYFNQQGQSSVHQRHITLFFKNFRKAFPEARLRYYVCAEYGGRTYRPHYHVLLFGSGCDKNECKSAIAKHWHHGHVHCGTVGPASIRYCANFHVHKCSTPEGCDPSFTTMSRRPGIGGLYFDDKIDNFISNSRRFVVFDGIKYNFGRYWHNRFCQATGEVPPTAGFDYWEAFLQSYPDDSDVRVGKRNVDLKLVLVNRRHKKL